MNHHSGYVSGIKETSDNCKFIINDKNFIFFKNKQAHVYDEITSKIVNKKSAKILFTGMFVSVYYDENKTNGKYKNIIADDILVDTTYTNNNKWVKDFILTFKSDVDLADRNLKKKEDIDLKKLGLNNKDARLCAFKYMLRNVKNPRISSMYALFVFYENLYNNLKLYTNLKNIVTQKNIKPTQLICKNIKKVSEAINRNKLINYDMFCKNPFIIINETTSKCMDVLIIFASHFDTSLDNIITGLATALLHNNYMSNGHMCAPKELLINQVFKSLLVNFHDVDQNIDLQGIEQVLSTSKLLKEYNNYLLMADVYSKVEYVSERVKDLIESHFENEYQSKNSESGETNTDNQGSCEIDDYISKFEEEKVLKLNNKQKKAIAQVFRSPNGISLITGLPGSGKTAIVSCIRYISDILNHEYVLAAPTGKSANKMGKNAYTIHRLLECFQKTSDDGFKFTKNEKNPIAAKIIIVDEISMLDFMMFYHLIKACDPDSIIVLLGDNNQLPSIAFGDVINALIKSLVPHVHLTKIYRQDECSMIPVVSKMITEKKTPTIKNLSLSNDITLLQIDNASKIQKYVLAAYNKNNDVQILIPSNKGEVGNMRINELIHLNNCGDDYIDYYNGEKIICISNHYARDSNNEVIPEESIFNGEVGVFKETTQSGDAEIIMAADKSLMVPKNIIDYGYSISVHKSQGSEYDEVIFILHNSHQPMLLTNEMLYTAITRAKKKITIISTYELLDFCVQNNNKKRFDILADLLNDGFDIE